MKVPSKVLTSLIILTILYHPVYSQSQSYLWLQAYDSFQTIANRIPVPHEYQRVNAISGTFQDWLRYLPLKEGNPPVYLYNGKKKTNQTAHIAVVDMDVGDKDLQQCTDAVIRLRAEYLYSVQNFDAIHFNFTNGDRTDFTQWIDGNRPKVNEEKVQWIKTGVVDSSYFNFRRYLDNVFMYAGSYSLSQEMKRVQDMAEMRIGDVFIQGGFPGHSVIVVDMAIHKRTGYKVFLLAQSFIPAQDIHVLKNPTNSSLCPWYRLDFGETLKTPEWTFRKDQLMRF